jgi:hypothetical protein
MDHQRKARLLEGSFGIAVVAPFMENPEDLTGNVMAGRLHYIGQKGATLNNGICRRIPPWEVKDERLGEGGTQTFVEIYYTTFPKKRKRKSLQFHCSFLDHEHDSHFIHAPESH